MSLKAPKNIFKEGTKTLYWVRGQQWEDVDGNIYEQKLAAPSPVEGEKQQPYFKLSRNEHGKAWLFYKPCGDGRYNCWEPIGEEFYSEFEKIQQERNKTIQECIDSIQWEGPTIKRIKDELSKLKG